MENPSLTTHREWLHKVNGTKIPEITSAKAMPGLECVPLDGLVVSDNITDWEHIKQPIIPLTPTTSDDVSTKASRELRMLRADLIAEHSFLVLVKDEQLGGKDNWALSIIDPKKLLQPEEELRKGMEVLYSIGSLEQVRASSLRATLLIVSGKQSI